MSEEGGIGDGSFNRVRFKPAYKTTIMSAFPPNECQDILRICSQMTETLLELENCGAAPILADGKVAGNGAVLYKDHLIVSKSGKDPGRLMDRNADFCVVKNFDYTGWSVDYFGHSPDILPTSDTPLHFSTLHLVKTLGWSEIPEVVLHGHALATEEEAERFGFPCSTEKTSASTPEDVDALIKLIRKYPYPENKVYIRKGHGFILLGKDVEDATQTFRKLIVPCLS